MQCKFLYQIHMISFLETPSQVLYLSSDQLQVTLETGNLNLAETLRTFIFGAFYFELFYSGICGPLKRQGMK